MPLQLTVGDSFWFFILVNGNIFLEHRRQNHNLFAFLQRGDQRNLNCYSKMCLGEK